MKPLFLLDALVVALTAAVIAGAALISIDHANRAHASDSFAGTARVIDGDTLAVGPDQVRLWGIDTPETCQKGFAEASGHLTELIAGSDVRCSTASDAKSYGRFIVRCSTAAIPDLAARMVLDGYAVDWPKYSAGAYADEQTDALRSKRGLWNQLIPWDPATTHHVCP